MSNRVLVLPKYSRRGASSRLRTFQYLPFLEKLGCNITVKPLFDQAYLDSLYAGQRRSRISLILAYLRRFIVILSFFRYRFIWLEKELFPYVPAWVEVSLSWVGVRYVVDYDDAIFHNYDLSHSWIVRRLLGRKIDTVMRHATCVVAGNDYLAARASAAGAKRIIVVPTVVDHRRYSPGGEPDATITIGWIGSPSTQKYVEQLLPALQALGKQYAFRLLLVGATTEILARLPNIDVTIIPWSENTEADLIRQMDIGVMPLEDGPWENGKCGYKLIQYMASGVPVVASPVGVNLSIVDGAVCGFLARDLNDWRSSLSKLIDNPALRDQFGAAGLAAVKAHYSIASQLPVLVSCFSSLEEDND